MPSGRHGFGFYGPDAGTPTGGLCVSAFLLVRRGEDLLVGTMAEDSRWVREWAPNLALYQGDQRTASLAGLRFPATYLRVGEHPNGAALRVWTNQLGLVGTPPLPRPTIVSEAGPSRRYDGATHWDLAFVYEVGGPGEAPLAREAGGLAHWQSLRYASVSELARTGMAFLHDELLKHVAVQRVPR